MSQFRIGLIREGQVPTNAHVALVPSQCKQLLNKHSSLEIYLQPSKHRSYSAQEYSIAGVHAREYLKNCDILMGIEPVPVTNLIPRKTYLFFSNILTKQSYNIDYLNTLLLKKINLIDYKALKLSTGERIVGFNYIAGLIGAHNALWMWGKRTKSYQLKQAFEHDSINQLSQSYDKLNKTNIKILVAGEGRAAEGVMKTLDEAKIKNVPVKEFFNKKSRQSTYTQLILSHLYSHKKVKKWDKEHFNQHMKEYDSNFASFVSADLLINALDWEAGMSKLFTKEQMKDKQFKIQAIVDIMPDINGAIPAASRITTIQNPIYSYIPSTERIMKPFQKNSIDIMAIDNLSNELPRDASREFGNGLVEHVMELLLTNKNHEIIKRATITDNGTLMPAYSYLK